MDKLKSFIDKNREAFNDIELPEGHFERFQSKLPASFSSFSHWKQYFLYGLIAAASITLLFFVTFPPEWMEDKLQEAHEVCENREEFRELKIYYEMQIYEIVSEMESLSETNESPALGGFIEASHQVLSATLRFEKNVLPELPCSEEGLFVLNQHYSNSLQSLTCMLERMEHYKENEINN